MEYLNELTLQNTFFEVQSQFENCVVLPGNWRNTDAMFNLHQRPFTLKRKMHLRWNM